MENKVKLNIWYKWKINNTHIRPLSIKNGRVEYEYSDGYKASAPTEDEFLLEAEECPEMNSNRDQNFDYFQKDNVINPVHYTTTKISALDVVNDWDLGFYLGNTIKYIKRYKLKGNPVQDLKKGIQYMQLLVDKLEKEGVDLENKNK